METETDFGARFDTTGRLDGAPTSKRSYQRVIVPCCSARHAILPIVRMHRLISTVEMPISVQRITNPTSRPAADSSDS